VKKQKKLSFKFLNREVRKPLPVTKIGLVFLGVLIAFVGQSQVPQSVMQQVYNEVKTPFKYGLVVAPTAESKKLIVHLFSAKAIAGT
jgi:hypothetical protein